jgi:hypothetical protein
MGKLNSYRLRHQKMTKAVMRKSMPIADQTTSQCLVLTCDYRDCHSGKGVLFAISSLVESELKHSDRRTLKTMIFTFCFFAIALVSFGQELKLKGKVLSRDLKEPMVFVTISFADGKRGTTSDIDGNYQFSVSSDETEIKFSYVGYQPQSFSASELQETDIVYLTAELRVLDELAVLAGENPAHPIIRQLIANKKKYDPQNLPAYYFESYNKFVVGSDMLPPINEKDSNQLEMRNAFRDNYFFLMETVTSRHYKKPEKVEEVVLANRVSGFADAQIATLASSFQDLGFYQNYVSLLGVNYLNPITRGSFGKYYFDLVDSVYDRDGRKSYVIAFDPIKNNFNGLKGILHVDAEDMALRKVIAETGGFTAAHKGILEGVKDTIAPSAKGYYDFRNQRSNNFKIQQNYIRLEREKWFPDQLKVDFFAGWLVDKGSPTFPLMGIGKSYLKNIELDPDLDEIRFNRTALRYDPQSMKRDEDYWSNYRIADLTPKEMNTYRVVDSVVRKNKLDVLMKIIPALIEKKYPLGKVDINFNRVFDFNQYEGFRFGVGLSTSPELSKKFELGGYYAYGIKDGGHKYGAYLDVPILSEKRLHFYGNYSNDVRQFAGSTFYKYRTFPLESELFYRFYVGEMVTENKAKASLRWYWMRYLDTELSLEKRKVTINNTYRYQSGADATPIQAFDMTEVTLRLGYNYGENYIQVLNVLLPTSRSNFYVGASFTHGISGLWDGQFTYSKFEAMLQKRFMTVGLGQPTFTILGGVVDQDVPASEFFAIRGTGGEYLDVYRSFRTMRFNEFVANKYVTLFYQHFVSKAYISKRIQPHFFLVGAMAAGNLEAPEKHIDPYFNPLRDNYYEGGLLIRQIFSLGSLGFGVGGYYRLGPYAYASPSENLFFKLDISFFPTE